MICGEAGVADDVQVVGERGRTRDVGLHARRGLRLLDDLADGLDAFVGQGLALFAGQVDHHVGGLAVGALRTGRGQRVAPEVLDVLDVLGILLQLADDLVVVVVRVGAERLLALDDDHDVLLESNSLKLAPISFIACHRRRVLGSHRSRMEFADDLELRGDHVHHARRRRPRTGRSAPRGCGACAGRTGRLGCSSVSAGAIACVMRTSPGSTSGR